MQDSCYNFPQSFSMSEGESHDLESVHHGAVIIPVVDRGTLKPTKNCPLHVFIIIQYKNYIKNFVELYKCKLSVRLI